MKADSGENPYLEMEVQDIAAELRTVEFQRAVALGEYREHLDQNKGWLLEALYIGIETNRTKSNE